MTFKKSKHCCPLRPLLLMVLIFQILQFKSKLIELNKIKIRFKLPDISFTVTDTRDYVEYILKKREKIIVNLQKESISKILKIELTTIKLLGRTEKKIKRSKNGEHVSTYSLFLPRVSFFQSFQVFFIVFNCIFSLFDIDSFC